MDFGLGWLKSKFMVWTYHNQSCFSLGT